MPCGPAMIHLNITPHDAVPQGVTGPASLPFLTLQLRVDRNMKKEPTGRDR